MTADKMDIDGRGDVEPPSADEPPATNLDAQGGDAPVEEPGDGGPPGVRYEVVFDARDRMVGNRLVGRVLDVIGPTFTVTKGDEGPTWSITIEFPDVAAADKFFGSDFYRQFCIEVRRAAHSSVLVVPLGSADG